MNRAAARLLTRLYPRVWRERYGEEFEALLESQEVGLRTVVNVLCSAFREHVVPTRGDEMDQTAHSFGGVMKQPAALVPVGMSLIALTLVLVHVVLHGAAREADEGTTAHLWQLLMAGQLPLLTYFAIRWLPRAPRPTLYVLGVQAGAALASMAPVFFLGL